MATYVCLSSIKTAVRGAMEKAEKQKNPGIEVANLNFLIRRFAQILERGTFH